MLTFVDRSTHSVKMLGDEEGNIAQDFSVGAFGQGRGHHVWSLGVRFLLTLTMFHRCRCCVDVTGQQLITFGLIGLTH